MMKWIGRSIYILLITFVSVTVFRIAYTAKLQKYYETEIKDFINDEETLLRGLNTLLQINYYREDPLLYQYQNATGDYQFNLAMYAIGITADNNHYDGMMLVINNLKITENDEIVENPILKMSVTLSHETLLVNKTYTNTGSIYYDPSQPFSIYNVPALFLFDAENYLLVPDTNNDNPDVFATIDTVTLEYSNGSTDDDNNYIFNEVPMFVGSKVEYNEMAHFKDSSFSIDPELYQINANFGENGLTDDVINSFNLVTDQDSLKPYNGTVWRIMSIYVLAVVVVTYFLFFHKYVRERMRSKTIDVSSNNDDKEIVTIFKDHEIKETKDGKK